MKVHTKFLCSVLLFLIISPLYAIQTYKTGVTASYYAEAFHGKRTSNGEIFNMYSLTCAHKSLPFNTVLKVTNLRNGKTVEVRVNDRGPFILNREIDLSKAAAVKLNMIGTGTAKVKLEIVKMGPDTKISRQTAKSASKIMAKRFGTKTTKQTVVRPAGTKWDIQLGAFSQRDNANRLAQKLLRDGFKDVVFQKTETMIKVAIRNIDAKDVNAVEKQLQAKGYTTYTIKKRL
ncbi:MAG: septal ring lytic transglycosylase RlpA family protein [Treponema sp.]|nr:septal ring lytic transglycosylase RlpA family protein [Treponema sp.]